MRKTIQWKQLLLLAENEANGFKFGSSKDMAASQVLNKAVKEHRVHK